MFAMNQVHQKWESVNSPMKNHNLQPIQVDQLIKSSFTNEKMSPSPGINSQNKSKSKMEKNIVEFNNLTEQLFQPDSFLQPQQFRSQQFPLIGGAPVQILSDDPLQSAGFEQRRV